MAYSGRHSPQAYPHAMVHLRRFVAKFIRGEQRTHDNPGCHAAEGTEQGQDRLRVDIGVVRLGVDRGSVMELGERHIEKVHPCATVVDDARQRHVGKPSRNDWAERCRFRGDRRSQAPRQNPRHVVMRVAQVVDDCPARIAIAIKTVAVPNRDVPAVQRRLAAGSTQAFTTISNPSNRPCRGWRFLPIAHWSRRCRRECRSTCL